MSLLVKSINPEIDQEIIKGLKTLRNGVPQSTKQALMAVTYFLEISAYLLDYKKFLDDTVADHQADLDLVYQKLYTNLSGAITERKQAIKSDTEYQDIEVSMARYKSEAERVKGYIKIFEHAHLTFRQAIKE